VPERLEWLNVSGHTARLVKRIDAYQCLDYEASRSCEGPRCASESKRSLRLSPFAAPTRLHEISGVEVHAQRHQAHALGTKGVGGEVHRSGDREGA